MHLLKRQSAFECFNVKVDKQGIERLLGGQQDYRVEVTIRSVVIFLINIPC